MATYALIDSGDGEKLEQFGPFLLARPSSGAVWRKQCPEKWEKIDARFTREGEGGWNIYSKMPSSWEVMLEGLKFKVAPTDFGHLGIFPDHHLQWRWVERQKPKSFLNLFAYSGGLSLAAARCGAEVCHLDASKGMVSWARENAALNGLDGRPIRWIVDDVVKFLKREVRRGRRYDAVALDPPSFGRGSSGEVFKIERDLLPILDLIKDLLSETPQFVLLSAHTSGFSPIVLSHLLESVFGKAKIEKGENVIESDSSFSLPNGAYARWIAS